MTRKDIVCVDVLPRDRLWDIDMILYNYIYIYIIYTYVWCTNLYIWTSSVWMEQILIVAPFLNEQAMIWSAPPAPYLPFGIMTDWGLLSFHKSIHNFAELAKRKRQAWIMIFLLKSFLAIKCLKRRYRFGTSHPHDSGPSPWRGSIEEVVRSSTRRLWLWLLNGVIT